MKTGILKRLGATRLEVWSIKHVVTPLDRRLYRWTNGRFLTFGRLLMPSKTGQRIIKTSMLFGTVFFTSWS